jgi:hypothetical protein
MRVRMLLDHGVRFKIRHRQHHFVRRTSMNLDPGEDRMHRALFRGGEER